MKGQWKLKWEGNKNKKTQKENKIDEKKQKVGLFGLEKLSNWLD